MTSTVSPFKAMERMGVRKVRKRGVDHLLFFLKDQRIYSLKSFPCQHIPFIKGYKVHMHDRTSSDAYHKKNRTACFLLSLYSCTTEILNVL